MNLSFNTLGPGLSLYSNIIAVFRAEIFSYNIPSTLILQLRQEIAWQQHIGVFSPANHILFAFTSDRYLYFHNQIIEHQNDWKNLTSTTMNCDISHQNTPIQIVDLLKTGRYCPFKTKNVGASSEEYYCTFILSIFLKLCLKSYERCSSYFKPKEPFLS